MRKALAYLLAVAMLCTATAACTQSSGINAGENSSPISAASLVLGDYIQLGKYNNEPILWRYVADDENGKLILSDKILCFKQFDGRGYNGDSHARFKQGQETSRNYWADSNIRSWLNSSAPAGEVEWLCGNPPVPCTIKYFDYTYTVPGYEDEKGFLAEGNFTQSERSVIKEVTQKSLLDRTDAALAVGGSESAWGSVYQVGGGQY